MFMTEWTVGAGVGFAQARALREAVRVREQGISPEQEFDAMDAVAAHLFVCLFPQSKHPWAKRSGSCSQDLGSGPQDCRKRGKTLYFLCRAAA